MNMPFFPPSSSDENYKINPYDWNFMVSKLLINQWGKFNREKNKEAQTFSLLTDRNI